MKKFSKILCAIVAASVFCGGMTVVGGFKANAAEEAVTPKLQMYLNIGENIAFNTIATLPENATGVSATYAWNDGEVDYEKTITTEDIENFKQNGNEYTFVYRGVTPEYMASVINVTVNYNGLTLTGSQSIKGYLENIINSKPETLGDYTYEKLKTLAYDMLDYGAAAQAYRGETDENKFVNGNNEKGNSFFESDITADYAATVASVKWGVGARYDYAVKPVVKFTLKDGVTATDVNAKVTFDGETNIAELEQKDGAYLVVIPNFSLLDVDKTFTVEVFDGETKLDSLTTNFATLAKKISNNNGNPVYTTNSDAKLIASTYVYAKTAIEYKAASDTNEKTFTFEAEDAYVFDKDKGYGIAKDGLNGESYISNFNNAASDAYISFKFNSENDCTAKLIVSTTRYKGENRKFNEVFGLYLNGTKVSVDGNLGVGEYQGEESKKWITFFDTEITTLNLKKGVNELKFNKVSKTLNFDAIKLVSDTNLYVDTYIYEAEDAVKSENFGKTENASTASGGKLLADLNSVSSSATLTFTVLSDCNTTAKLFFRTNGHHTSEYSLASYYKVNVNGASVNANSGAKLAKNMVMKDNNCWYAFHDTEFGNVSLVKGSNTIVISNINASLNFDAIKIMTSANLNPEGVSELKIEAEDCVLIGSARATTETGMNNPSGGKFVGGLSMNVGSVTFTVFAYEKCTVDFVLCYGNRTNDETDRKFPSKFTLTHNGNALTSSVVFNNGTENNYFGWEEYVICTVDLQAGENTFVLTSTGVTASNIDYFVIKANGNFLAA